jgi:hypothetical protein
MTFVKFPFLKCALSLSNTHCGTAAAFYAIVELFIHERERKNSISRMALRR